uniref:Uncharacterized protein n=1 Tax=Arundo donax TaxID=35708 RepID=A0A0A9EL18_ARUDO
MAAAYGKREREREGVERLVCKGTEVSGAAGAHLRHRAGTAARPHGGGSCRASGASCGRVTEWLMESLRKDATEADMACPGPRRKRKWQRRKGSLPLELQAHQTVAFNRAMVGVGRAW